MSKPSLLAGIVFDAGSGQGRTSWDPVVPLLADRTRLVAYDRAGFGRSRRRDHRRAA